MTSGPDVDTGAVNSWLDQMYAGAAGHIQIVSTGNWVGRAFPVAGRRSDLVQYVLDLDRRAPQGIFARVTTLSSSPVEVGKRGGEELTASLPGLWADIDITGPGHRHTACAGGQECTHFTDTGRQRHRTRILPLPPDRASARAIVETTFLPPASVWVDSGGGMYPIWRLDHAHPVHPGEVAELADLSARWQELLVVAAARLGWHYGSGVGDLARVLRLPGTWNRKTEEPRLCHVVEDTGSTYTIADLRDLLAEAWSQMPAPEPPPVPVPPTRVRAGDDVKPGIDFAERIDWSEADPRFGLLGLLGWRETYRLDSGERGWLRPGGHSQLSATTGRGGHDNLWVFSDATEFAVGEPISKFEAYRIIHGHATHKEATLALNALGFGSPPKGQAAPGAQSGGPPDFDWPSGVVDSKPDTVLPAALTMPGTETPLTSRDTVADTVNPAGVPADAEAIPADVEEDEAEEEEVDSWLPIDLGPYLRGEIERPEPTMGLARSDGVRMVYPGCEHAVIGEMEAGKTWWALACAAAEMLAERHVIYIHFEESDPSGTVERLLLLGCNGQEILTYFHFVAPSQAVKPKQRKRLARSGAALVILDGVNEGMSLHKAEIRDESGAAEFRRRIVKPFTRHGAAVINLDHVVKDAESRGRYALGSIHKGNAIDGAIVVLETMQAFGRNKCGKSAVYVTKDRQGFLRQHGQDSPKMPGKTFMGVFMVDDTRTNNPGLDLQFWAPVEREESSEEEGENATDIADDAAVLAAIVALVRESIAPSFKLVRAKAGLRQTRVHDALARLVISGKVAEGDGPRGARIFTPRLFDDLPEGTSESE